MNSCERTPARVPTTQRLAAGATVPSREVTTIGAGQVRLPASDLLTHLQFRRFAACPVCNVHLRSVARRHAEIVAAGIREVAVFHSTVEAMLPYQGDLPFAVVADADRHLYTEFGVESSSKANVHPQVWAAALKPQSWSVVASGLRAGGKLGLHGDSMLGLPADFLIAPDGQVLAAHYGTHANDQWSVDELLRHAHETTRRSNHTNVDAEQDQPASKPVRRARVGTRIPVVRRWRAGD